jgi:iron complex outermembrane receptor protein
MALRSVRRALGAAGPANSVMEHTLPAQSANEGTMPVKIQARLRSAAAPVALSVILAAQPVLAQEEPETEQTAEAEDTTDEDEGAIFVTGSRVRRDEFSAPAPITVIDPEIAVRQGLMDTSEMIQGSPIASGSSQITAAFSSQYLTNGGQGVQTVSLRGLGPERTLVLLNDRRAGPAGTRGAVAAFDLNVLPQSILETVDILKDGASSIYGSDAVAGVVNLKTKRNTDGFEFDVFGSLPYNSGGEVFSATGMWGKTFDGGHILAAGTYYKQNEVARGDRSYLQCEEAYTFTDETFTTRADLIDPRTGRYACSGGESNITWGHIWTYDYSYYYGLNSNMPTGENPLTFGPGVGEVSLLQYSYPGDNLGQYIPGVPAGGPIYVPAGWYPIGYGPASEAVQNSYHPNMNTDTVIPETERFTMYLDGAIELLPGVEAYTELLYNKRKTYFNSSFQVWQFGLPESTNDTVAPGDLGDPMAAGWRGPITLSPTAYNDHWDSWQEVDYYRGVLGFRGDISADWSWDVYGQYSLSDGDYSNERVLNDSIRTQDGRTSVNAPNGWRTARCPGGVTPIGGKTCVGVDWYSPRVMYGDFTQAEADFLFDVETGNTEYTQWYIEGVVTGDSGQWFELPGGPVGMAIGATFRHDEIEDVPGAITLAGNAWQSSRSGITAGKTETMEAFGEVVLPVLADMTLVRSLTLTGAGRVTNVKAIRSDGLTDETKGNFTYKVGADWEVTDWLRFRGTYGTSFRAPALFEQFLADETGGLSQRTVDPCIQWGLNLAQGNISQRFADNCAADGVPANHTGAGISVVTYTGGGFGLLEPETSKAWTASMILTPKFPFAPNTNVSLAFDYFDIEVNGEIAQLGAANIVSSCYASDFFPTDPLCDLFARVGDLDPSDPDWNAGSPNNIARVRDSFLNVNSQQSEGLDVTARIQHDFAGDTTLTFQAQMTWQFEDRTALFSGLFEDDNGEAGEPKWVGDFRLILDHGPWSLFYGLDAIGATNDEEDWLDANGTLCPTYITLGTVCMDLTLPATFYHNISATHEIGNQFEITVGVANLFGQKPPRSSSINANGINNFGRGVLYSQYDLIGTRFFANVNARF